MTSDPPMSNYAANVRAQYEEYPFPQREPSHERHRLIVSEQHYLGKLNHFCFAGRQTFGNGFRVLVAGGGTGDQTIFLSEQLRDYNASVVYLDFSEASLGIAKARAKHRGLDNVEFRHGSILDLAQMGLGDFDLITSTGVLHHLKDPDAGLEALRGVLKPHGAMSLMLYGRLGRMAVYQAQALFRSLNQGISEPKRKVRFTSEVLKSLPTTNWLMRGGDREKILEPLLNDEPNLYDLLLHEQDVAYSVPELYDMLARADLELIDFTHFHHETPFFRYLYDPLVWITDPQVREHVVGLPRATQQGIAEAIHCMITCHSFYAAPQARGRIAMPGQSDLVPYFLHFDPAELGRTLREGRSKTVPLRYRHSTAHLQTGPFTSLMFDAINGERTIPEIFDLVRKEAKQDIPENALRETFLSLYQPLNSFDVLLLRHRSVGPFKDYLNA